MESKMKVFWSDGDRGVEAGDAETVDLREALRLWTEEVHGTQGSFLGLIDDEDRTIQFYFDESIPQEIGDAEHLEIVCLDFPVPEQRGSYTTRVRIGEVASLMERAYAVGADPKQFGGLCFEKW